MDDPEIVVWFCLSDKLSNEYPTNESFKKAMDHSNEKGPYSTSPNDVRNNYYIYSNGNIMYTGVGHSSMDAVTAEGEKVEKYRENEVKLFINTMIAAYSAGIEPPTVEITNKEAVKNSSDEYILYEYSEKPDDLDGNVKRICCSALGKIGDIRSEDALINCLEDSRPQIKQYAVKALGKIKSKKSLYTLNSICQNKNEKDYVIRAAAQAISDIEEAGDGND
jgi:hypothetical protein